MYSERKDWFETTEEICGSCSTVSDTPPTVRGGTHGPTTPGIQGTGGRVHESSREAVCFCWHLSILSKIVR